MRRSTLPLTTSLLALVIGSNALIMGNNSLLMSGFSSAAPKNAPTQKTGLHPNSIREYFTKIDEAALIVPQHRALVEQGRLRCLIEDFKAAGKRPACDQKDIHDFASSMPRAKTNETYRQIVQENRYLRMQASALGLNPYSRSKAP